MAKVTIEIDFKHGLCQKSIKVTTPSGKIELDYTDKGCEQDFDTAMCAIQSKVETLYPIIKLAIEHGE